MATQTRKSTNYALTVNGATKARSEHFHDNQYGERHYQAWIHPRKGSEAMIKGLIVGWVEYADQYHMAQRFEPSNTLAEDYYAGDYWLAIGKSIIALLSMDLGRLDGGLLDGLVREIATNEGFTKDLTHE